MPGVFKTSWETYIMEKLCMYLNNFCTKIKLSSNSVQPKCFQVHSYIWKSLLLGRGLMGSKNLAVLTSGAIPTAWRCWSSQWYLQSNVTSRGWRLEKQESRLQFQLKPKGQQQENPLSREGQSCGHDWMGTPT